MLGEQRIERLLGGATSLDAAVRALVDDANREGGRDNITAVAFRLDDAAAPAQAGREPDPGRPQRQGRGLHRGGGAPPGGRGARPGTARGAADEAQGPAAGGEGARGDRRPRLRSCLGAAYGIRQVWFLGTDEGGRVALYRGLPYDLPFGISLYDERYASPIQTSSLSGRQRGAVTGHDLRSRSDARR